MPEDAFLLKDDYRWHLDADLGWTFTSDEYDCYSIRNRNHTGKGEGRFPFALWNGAVAAIRDAVG